MRIVFFLLVAACTLYVIHYLVPQPNGAGDLAAIVAGYALIYYVIKGRNGEL